MLNRRLLILFLAFLVGFGVLAARLAKLQLVDSAYWKDELNRYVHRHYIVEIQRGSILDRNGQILAHDVPADELAIDYRAMNYDDAWLTNTAIDRLKADNEWGHFPDRPTRNRRIDEIKVELASQIATIPQTIASIVAREDHLDPAVVQEEVLQRFQEIRSRIQALRQNFWSRQFDRNNAQSDSASSRDAAESDDKALDARYRSTQLRDELVAHSIRSNISPAVANYFRQHHDDLPGLIVRDNANRRDYPFGEATAHIVGTLGPVDGKSLAENRFDLPDLLTPGDVGNLAGYLSGDRMGESGAEKTLETPLKGIRGVRLIELSDSADVLKRDAAARPSDPAPDPRSSDTTEQDTRHIDPTPGKDVRLTIDASLQQDIYAQLADPARQLRLGRDGENHFAAMVILSMDGQLLSVISYPSYDPNTLDRFRAQLNNDSYRFPLVNRATRGVYQPGSTVKPLLAAAGLTEKVITTDEEITCTGHLYPDNPTAFRDLEVHGPIALVDAISLSCNVYFYTVGQRLGLQRLHQWYDLYGLGRDTGMELPEETGTIPNPAKYKEADAAVRASIFAGIGQDSVGATPLQMANAYATLLRGGTVIPPRILMDTPPTSSHPFTISDSILASVRRGMERCVTVGTAKSKFRDFKLPVAGKTGTAEKERFVFDDNGNPVDDPTKPLTLPNGTPRLKPDGTPAFRQLVDRQNDAWFIGYAPAKNPQFVVAAVLEWGGHGGTEAAPMVREAFRQLELHNYLPHLDVP